MGTYCYKISRKSRKVADLPNEQTDVYIAEYAYKLGSYITDEADLHRKIVGPTARAWDKYLLKNFPMTMDSVLFVMDFEDGADVYQRSNVDWIDGGPPGRLVGQLAMDGQSGRMRFMKPKMKNYKVTFAAYEHTGREDGSVCVEAACELGAELKAKAEFFDDVREGNFYRPFSPKVEQYERQMTKNEALSLAMRALDKSSGFYSLTDRVNARKILKEMVS